MSRIKFICVLFFLININIARCQILKQEKVYKNSEVIAMNSQEEENLFCYLINPTNKNILTDNFAMVIYFQVEKSTPLNTKNDTLNKRFIRFLHFSYWRNGELNFSISMEKLDPPSSITEPFTGVQDWYEENTIVDTSIYLKFKKFILNNENLLKHNLGDIGKDDDYSIEIDIDYKNRYYLSSHDAIKFLPMLVNYLKKEKVQGYYLENLKNMIYSANYAIKYKDKLPKEPN